MLYLLTTILLILIAGLAYCAYELYKIKEQKNEELVKDRPKGIVTDREWLKTYFNNLSEEVAAVVYIEVIELEQLNDKFSKIGFIKVSGNIHENEKKWIKKQLPTVIERNRLTWSNKN